MNRNLTEDDLNKALSPENDSITPSSGFAGSVMSTIASYDATPRKIPFPWKQALPGLAATTLMVLLLAAAFVFAFRTWKPSASVPADLQTVLTLVPKSLVAAEAEPLLGALAAAIACLALTHRLMLPRS